MGAQNPSVGRRRRRIARLTVAPGRSSAWGVRGQLKRLVASPDGPDCGKRRQILLKWPLHAAVHGINYRGTLGCSQVVRQLFLVQCTVGSNPTIPATTL